MKKTILMPRIAPAAVLAVLLPLLHGCISLRSDFIAVDEQVLVGVEKSINPFAWQSDRRQLIVAGREGTAAFLRFPSSGHASLLDSVVSDFRMEFAVRLEAPVEHEIATAMINFRNYFDRRYCLIVEPYSAGLYVAQGQHSNLVELVRAESAHALGAWYLFEIVAVGGRIKVFRNGVLLIDLEDKASAPWQGNITFESHSVYSFKDVVLARISGFVKKEPQKSAAAAAAPIAGLKEKLIVAVSGFEGRGVEASQASLLTDIYSTALLSTGVFRVVERSQIAKILAEQELQLSDVSDAKTAVSIGNLMNAEYLSSGSVGRLGGQYVVTVRLLRVKTGETVVSVQKNYADAEKIPGGIATLCAEMAGKVLGK